MMKQFYWDGDTFGSGPIPKNWEEICDAVNDELDTFALFAGGDNDYLVRLSAKWWEHFCRTDGILGIRAIWED